MAGIFTAFMAGFEDLEPVKKISGACKLEARTLLKAVVAVAAVALVALLYLGGSAGGLFAGGELKVESTAGLIAPPATSFENVAPASETTGTSDASVLDRPAPAGTVVVYVSGAVVTPGLYTLSAESRLGDAVALAGGLLSEADPAAINLAQRVSDGLQIHLPRVGEAAQPVAGASGGDTSSGGGGSGASAGSSAGETNAAGATGLVNINTASLAALQTLNGVGPATAQKIIDYRAAHGSFKSKEELKQVTGIGEKKYAALERYITV